MSVSNLSQLVSPPDSPIDPGSVDHRQNLESEIGLVLPDDVYEFIAVFGSGMFSDTLNVLNPFSSSYLDTVNQISECYRGLKLSEGDALIPYEIHPNRPGLFPCATEVNGGLIFWLTEGAPAAWPLILMTVDFQFERRDVSLIEFLEQVFRGSSGCVLWDLDWVQANLVGVSFNPIQE